MIFSIKRLALSIPSPQLTHLQRQKGQCGSLSHHFHIKDGTHFLVLCLQEPGAGREGEEQKQMGCREEMRPTLEFNGQFWVAVRFLASGSSQLWVFS